MIVTKCCVQLCLDESESFGLDMIAAMSLQTFYGDTANPVKINAISYHRREGTVLCIAVSDPSVATITIMQNSTVNHFVQVEKTVDVRGFCSDQSTIFRSIAIIDYHV